ncbi:serine/threonine-protein kinase [Streptomyces sp. NPDC049954]|uniref:serine/threonine-protein kinase n=1 Tax=Streptomyces sp. NPDC049954 TaxID=3155779 RepID=UPI0034408A5F
MSAGHAGTGETSRLVAGRYRLATVLGEGGMGQVWTAYDQRLDRRVAVKLLRPDRSSGQHAEELRHRFARECRVTAQVDHPGLVTVHDAGTEGEDLFLVMRHVGGVNLAEHLARHRPYPWPWAVAVAAQLCSVLSAVHAVPIVHRDLKPHNIMIGEDGTVTVLDLGVASVMDTDTTRITQTGVPVGTPAYMAPEQARGGAVGPYTDLYALGVLLYELLSGEVPFSGSAFGVLHSHLYDIPVPVRQVRAEVPHALDTLVRRLLAKDPQARPRDAAAVHEALLPLLPARGTPAGALDPLRPFLRPHAPWPLHPAPAAPSPSRAHTPRPVTGGGVPDVTTAVDQVKHLLGEGRVTQAVDLLGDLLPAAAASYGEGSVVVRMLRKQYAATLMEDGQYRRALPELRRLVGEHAAGSGPADREVLRLRYEAAQCLEQLGEAASALREYRELLAYFSHPYAGDRLLALDVRRRIGHVLLAVGDHGAAHEALSSLLFDAERLHGQGHPLPAEIRRTLHWLSRVR